MTVSILLSDWEYLIIVRSVIIVHFRQVINHHVPPIYDLYVVNPSLPHSNIGLYTIHIHNFDFADRFIFRNILLLFRM